MGRCQLVSKIFTLLKFCALPLLQKVKTLAQPFSRLQYHFVLSHAASNLECVSITSQRCFIFSIGVLSVFCLFYQVMSQRCRVEGCPDPPHHPVKFRDETRSCLLCSNHCFQQGACLAPVVDLLLDENNQLWNRVLVLEDRAEKTDGVLKQVKDQLNKKNNGEDEQKDNNSLFFK